MYRWNCGRWAILLIGMVLYWGCQSKRSTPGGMPGVLLLKNGQPLADIQLSVFPESGSDELLGIGVSGLDGSFNLRDPQAHHPLWLEPGKYKLTLESVGTVPIRLPDAWGKPSKTPLRMEVLGRDTMLSVQVDGVK
ncbi:MAG: hypothetical protein U0905_00285 [Pirellulales bacterium]